MLVIIKTGATEIQRKLPIHFSTTLRCIPHFVIFSDMAEEIGEHRVHDVLSSVSENTKANNKDFLLYRKLQELQASGGTALNPNDTSYEEAWTLDKWKFLPMMGEALRARPDAKWFYFIETDTAVLWDNLFTYLSRFDPSEPLYIGCQTFIGDVWFAHGGTGWIMSEPAVRLVAEKWQNEQAGMEKLVSEQWAGDAVLALVLKDMGIGITTSWPILQGETPHSLDYTPHHWCYPVASYHHVDEKWIQAIYDFQEEWVAGGVSVCYFSVGYVAKYAISRMTNSLYVIAMHSSGSCSHICVMREKDGTTSATATELLPQVTRRIVARAVRNQTSVYSGYIHLGSARLTESFVLGQV
jgi:hypothetical protein